MTMSPASSACFPLSPGVKDGGLSRSPPLFAVALRLFAWSAELRTGKNFRPQKFSRLRCLSCTMLMTWQIVYVA
jgi:hypothetical protein